MDELNKTIKSSINRYFELVDEDDDDCEELL